MPGAFLSSRNDLILLRIIFRQRAFFYITPPPHFAMACIYFHQKHKRMMLVPRHVPASHPLTQKFLSSLASTRESSTNIKTQILKKIETDGPVYELGPWRHHPPHPPSEVWQKHNSVSHRTTVSKKKSTEVASDGKSHSCRAITDGMGTKSMMRPIANLWPPIAFAPSLPYPRSPHDIRVVITRLCAVFHDIRIVPTRLSMVS